MLPEFRTPRVVSNLWPGHCVLLAVLRGAGKVAVERRLSQVPAHYIAGAEKRHLDFGHCLLRLPDEYGQPTM
ncbi:MAG: hypothetical protein KGJ60_06025 [Verrucomicrobiota bacterium]|nr:hypothetical protein [Verrucomicrobiota bacterium]